MRPSLLPWILAGLALLLHGCVHRTPNRPREVADTSKGFYFHTHPRPQNSKDTLFVLCFSGGGTRAAALAMGVLEELRRTTVDRSGHPVRLLDEIDVISSVSGGSFAAAAYGCFGEQAFDRMNRDFLYRNVQRQLFTRTINPFRWNRLWSKTYGRSDLAADLYDELLFDGLRYSDIADRPGPYILINATDISTGARFAFSQYQFDLICSDLGSFRVSQAVAASSAVPGLLSPITLNNYAGRCESWSRNLQALKRQVDEGSASGRLEYHLKEVDSYLDSTNRPYLHLVDGGVSDNLGVRSVLDGLFAVESLPEVRRLFDLDSVDRVGVIVVNAYSAPAKDWDRREQPPGTLAAAVSGATIPMDRYSFETTALLREQMARWREGSRARHGQDPSARELEFFPVDVSFLGIEDPKERRYFLDLPTSFFLGDEAIDRLRRKGGQLLRESPEFRAFVDHLGGRRHEGRTP